MATVALTMIVKDEAHVIERCLAPLLPYVDFVLIHDTGSHDGTAGIAKAFLSRHKMPHRITVHQWEDFATNRSKVMTELAKQFPLITHGFMFDADNVFVPSITPEEFKAQLGHTDLVDVEVRTGGSSHTVPLLYTNRQYDPFQYRGVLHEFMHRSQDDTSQRGVGFYLNQIQDSARNKNPRKYQDDAAVLERALETETDPAMRSRYTFYLAQSYRDAGEVDKAADAYETRASLGGWDQEVFYSYLQVGKLLLSREKVSEFAELGALDSFLKAYQACPRRAESLHELATFYRLKGQWNLAYLYASMGVNIPPPGLPLFINRATYDWQLLDELAIAAYYTGRYQESHDLNVRLLNNWQVLPMGQRERIFGNLQFANQQLNKK